MPTAVIRDRNGSVAILTYQQTYRYKGWYFEMHSYLGPSLLKKNGDPRKIQPMEKHPWWPDFEEWMALSDEEKLKTREGYDG